MSTRRVCIDDGFDAAVHAAAEAFGRGEAVVFPTETVYGIGVVSGDAAALARLRKLKGRSGEKPFQFLVSDVAMARAMGAVFSGRAVRLAEAFWPGPLTLVVPDGSGDGATLGIRVPDSPFILAVIGKLRRPVVSSSANPAGHPPPLDADAADVFPAGPGGVSLVVDGGEVIGGVPSSVVRCGEAGIEILREGGIGGDVLRSVWDG